MRFAFTNPPTFVFSANPVSKICCEREATARIAPCSTMSKPNGEASRRDLLQLLATMGVSTAVSTLLPVTTMGKVITADPNAGAVTTKTSSGLEYYDFVKGSSGDSKMASDGSVVTVLYTLGTTGLRVGWLIESSTDHAPLTFKIGAGEVVKGLEEGVIGMREGGRRRMLIPAALGYHSATDRPVPVGFAEYQRFKNVYLNPDRQYRPTVVMDVTLLRIK